MNPLPPASPPTGNQPSAPRRHRDLDAIVETYGIDDRRTLADVITANTEITSDDLPVGTVFLLDPRQAEQADRDRRDGRRGERRA